MARPAHAIFGLALMPALTDDLLYLELIRSSLGVLGGACCGGKWLQLTDVYRDALLRIIDVLNDTVQVGDLLDDAVRACPRALKLDRRACKLHGALAHEDLLPNVHERIHVLAV